MLLKIIMIHIVQQSLNGITLITLQIRESMTILNADYHVLKEGEDSAFSHRMKGSREGFRLSSFVTKNESKLKSVPSGRKKDNDFFPTSTFK